MYHVLNIHVGQAGVQIGKAFWELYCLEHGLRPDGTSYSKDGAQISDGVYRPQTIFVDSEPTVVDEIRTGPYRQLFNSEYLITGKQDAADNFAIGFYLQPEIFEKVKEAIRKVMEACDNNRGIFLFHSIGGGTGSGLVARILGDLKSEYEKKCKLQLAIFPSPQFTRALEPYNAALHISKTVDTSNLVCILDNESIYHLYENALRRKAPSMHRMNQIIAQVAASITAAIRFPRCFFQSANFVDFPTNLKPFDSAHFSVVSYAPLLPSENSLWSEGSSVSEITSACFRADSYLASCHPQSGKYIACCLLYRGDVKQTDVNAAIRNIKYNRILESVDWSPTPTKIGINMNPPTVVPGGDLAKVKRSLCMLSNTTAIVDILSTLRKNLDSLLRQFAFTHHLVGQGLEQGEFYEAESVLQGLVDSYSSNFEE